MRIARVALPVLGLASAGYQLLGEVRDARRHPPPGERVDIGGRRLHVWQAGTGGPAVVIVPALSSPALERRAVQQDLAQDTSVVLYDRAGLGWSDPGPWPRSARSDHGSVHDVPEQAGGEQAREVHGVQPPAGPQPDRGTGDEQVYAVKPSPSTTIR